MRKIIAIAFLSVCCAFASYGIAMAQEIIGTWLGVGNYPLLKYASTLRFFPNGALQTELAGNEVVNCEGSYQYDGQILITHVSRCNGPGGGDHGGPIIFNGPNVFTYGDTTYRRQFVIPLSAFADETSLSLDRERALQPKDTFKECTDCPEMIVVPAGNFTMGSPETEKFRSYHEGPQHKVTIARPFAVSKFDVTFEEWDACAAHGDCDPYISDSFGRGRYPVINVGWDAAQNYVAWLGRVTGKPYRLMTEAEWEYAARAGSTTAYYWGDEIGRGNANCRGCGSQWEGRADLTGRLVRRQ